MQNNSIQLGSGDCYASMYYHIVWSTSNKAPFITSEYKVKLYNYILGIINRKRWFLFAIGGTSDHVHILIQKKPSDTISYLVSCIKSNSSRFMRINFIPEFSWQRGYGVFTVDTSSLFKVKSYIINQEVHHKQLSFNKEWTLLLKRSNISMMKSPKGDTLH